MLLCTSVSCWCNPSRGPATTGPLNKEFEPRLARNSPRSAPAFQSNNPPRVPKREVKFSIVIRLLSVKPTI